ncbi:MAG: hypothetical protein Q9180_008782, partial [Flavoplaca navasiana]
RTNVYNDCFCISHDGHCGTINGLRLGRLPPPQNVDWPEINAALGSAALLLATVASKLDVEFRGLRIKPMGSTSRIEKVDYAGSASQSSSTATVTPNATAARSSKNGPPNQSTSGKQQQQQQQPKTSTTLDLFSSGDLPLGANKLLHRRLNDGLVALLECIRQLGVHVESTSAEHQQQTRSPLKPRAPSPTSARRRDEGGRRREETSRRKEEAGILKSPYEIDKDEINGVSIRLGQSNDEQWTRACKYALTCCKFLLAHASNVGGGRGVD